MSRLLISIAEPDHDRKEFWEALGGEGCIADEEEAPNDLNFEKSLIASIVVYKYVVSAMFAMMCVDTYCPDSSPRVKHLRMATTWCPSHPAWEFSGA